MLFFHFSPNACCDWLHGLCDTIEIKRILLLPRLSVWKGWFEKINVSSQPSHCSESFFLPTQPCHYFKKPVGVTSQLNLIRCNCNGRVRVCCVILYVQVICWSNSTRPANLNCLQPVDWLSFCFASWSFPGFHMPLSSPVSLCCLLCTFSIQCSSCLFFWASWTPVETHVFCVCLGINYLLFVPHVT